MVELATVEWGARLVLRGALGGRSVAGMVMPHTPCRAARDGARAALWLGPDEWLLLGVDVADVAAGLAGTAHAAVDVGHRQLGFRLAGAEAAALLNAGVPLDLSLAAFPVGMCVRTLCEKTEIVLWREGEAVWRIEVARSFAPYLRAFFGAAAAADGLAFTEAGA